MELAADGHQASTPSAGMVRDANGLRLEGKQGERLNDQLAEMPRRRWKRGSGPSAEIRTSAEREDGGSDWSHRQPDCGPMFAATDAPCEGEGSKAAGALHGSRARGSSRHVRDRGPDRRASEVTASAVDARGNGADRRTRREGASLSAGEDGGERRGAIGPSSGTRRGRRAGTCALQRGAQMHYS